MVNQIKATNILMSKNEFGQIATTMEVIMPRFILAEFNTHRMFTRNSASSRAIPFKKQLESIEKGMFSPMAFQQDHKGMQGTEYLEGIDKTMAELIWNNAANDAIRNAKFLHERGVTKQLANRLLEPFAYHKVLFTATTLENFFNLRLPKFQLEEGKPFFSSRKFFKREHPMLTSIEEVLKRNQALAEIHMSEVASVIKDEYHKTVPNKLKGGEWHVPYMAVNHSEKYNEMRETVEKNRKIISEVSRVVHDSEIYLIVGVSSAEAARVSYSAIDGNGKELDVNKNISLFKKLATDGHFSPIEHPLRAMDFEEYDWIYRRSFVCNYEYFNDNKKKDDLVMVTHPNNEKSNMVVAERGVCDNFKGFISARFMLEKGLKIK